MGKVLFGLVVATLVFLGGWMLLPTVGAMIGIKLGFFLWVIALFGAIGAFKVIAG